VSATAVEATLEESLTPGEICMTSFSVLKLKSEPCVHVKVMLAIVTVGAADLARALMQVLGKLKMMPSRPAEATALRLWMNYRSLARSHFWT
jgi:hypothetical protein